MTDPELVLYTSTDGVALITVNDPDRRNAVNDAMSAQLRAPRLIRRCTPWSSPVRASPFAPVPT
jgi:hypothetical protein